MKNGLLPMAEVVDELLQIWEAEYRKRNLDNCAMITDAINTIYEMDYLIENYWKE